MRDEDYRTSTVDGAAAWARNHEPDTDDRPSRAEAEADEYYAGPTLIAPHERGIRCAHCKGRHATVADVRWCKDLTDEARAEAAAEQAAEARAERYFEEGPESFAIARAAEEEADRMRTLGTDPIWEVPPPIRNHEAVTYAGALGYTGECSDGERCDVYTRCHAHRAEDARNGVRNAHFKSYND